MWHPGAEKGADYASQRTPSRSVDRELAGRSMILHFFGFMLWLGIAARPGHRSVADSVSNTFPSEAYDEWSIK